MVICNHVNNKKCICHFHDNVYNLYSLWLNSKLITVVLLFHRDFFIEKNLWNIFRNALLNSKLLAVHQWEKLFINSKLFTLQKNLTRVQLWGTFVSHWRRVARVGYCGLSIKINAIGRRYRHTLAVKCTLNGNTLFGNIFTLKKGTETPMFNNSPALYRTVCFTCAQFWVTYSSELRSYASLKSENI